MTTKANAQSLRNGGSSRIRRLADRDRAGIKPPVTRKRFHGEWDELEYLYRKIIYWLYGRGDLRRALDFRDRFEQLLWQIATSHDAIFGEECWSILSELEGNLRGAIRHREREIDLILRLWEVSEHSPAKDVALSRYGSDALCDRLDLLAMLYHDAGDLDRAIVLLVESKRLCESTGSSFGWEDLLQEYLDEREPRFAPLIK